MKPIRLFYYQRRDGKVNFGDALSPRIFEAVTGHHVIRESATFADYAGLGSILQRVTRDAWRRVISRCGTRIKVWGSGFVADGPPKSRFMTEILAVRGPLTRERLGLGARMVMGDPGVFVPWLLASTGIKRYKWGIIPHYVDECSPALDRLVSATPRSVVIPVTIDPMLTLEMISQCENIVSSSLHGLISADAYEIPNWRVTFSNAIRGGDYKFTDYALGAGRSHCQSTAIPDTGNLDLLLEKLPDFNYQKRLGTVRDGLEKALKDSL